LRMQAAAASCDRAKLDGLPLLVLPGGGMLGVTPLGLGLIGPRPLDLLLVLLGLLEPPQAASASAELNMASAIARHLRRGRCCAVLSVIVLAP
jgi:hypothetical protein